MDAGGADAVRTARRARRLVSCALAVTIVLALAVALTIYEQQRNDEAAARGECYRVQYLRWSIDRFLERNWQADVASAALLSHGISVPVRTLGSFYAREAVADVFLPPTDCPRALSDPTHYRPPTEVPFGRALAVPAWRRFLASPPALPR